MPLLNESRNTNPLNTKLTKSEINIEDLDTNNMINNNVIFEEKYIAPPKANINKCAHIQCSKKIGLIQFSCRCGNSFCVTHRMQHTHNCDHDHAKLEKDKLVKEK